MIRGEEPRDVVTRYGGIPPLVLILAALALGVWASTPPAAVGADAAATAFSAQRAMGTVALVSRAPHPIGSPEAAEVRGRIADKMRATGMAVTPLRQVAAFGKPGERSINVGRVETLVGVLPGRDPALPAIAMMVHSDSAPDSFGAADDGAGVAVALETVRAIAAGPPRPRDVMLIATDGEEAGLLGARGFFTDPALAARVGAIVNIDSRGTAGLGAMFETGPGSGGLVALYRATATHRFAHSAATFLYRQLPNSTDLTAAMPAGKPALNFAFLDGEYDYHTPRDRLVSMDPRTLQSLGDQVLPTVRAVAEAETLPPRGADGVFADTALFGVRYPAWAGWGLIVASLVPAGWGLRGVRLVPAARAAAGTLAIGVGAMLAARFGYGLTGVGEDWGEHHRITADFLRFEIALAAAAGAWLLAGAGAMRGGVAQWRAAGACVALGIGAALLGRPIVPTLILTAAAALLAALAGGRRIEPGEVRAGTLAVGLTLSIALQIMTPPLTPLLLWPTLAASACAALARWKPGENWLCVAVALIPLAYTVVFAHAVLLALGVPTPEAVGPFALVAALLIAPLAGRRAAWPAAALAVAAAALLLSFRWSGPTERHPTLSQLWGLVDAHGRASRVSTLERPDPWTLAALRFDGGAVRRARLPMIASGELWRARARPIPLAPPRIVLTREGAWTSIRVAPAHGGRELRLRLAVDRPLEGVSVEGTPLPGFAAKPGAWRLRWRSPGDPATLRFRAAPGTRVSLAVGEMTELRLPVPPRPVTVVPWLGSDRIIVTNAARRRL